MYCRDIVWTQSCRITAIFISLVLWMCMKLLIYWKQQLSIFIISLSSKYLFEGSGLNFLCHHCTVGYNVNIYLFWKLPWSLLGVNKSCNWSSPTCTRWNEIEKDLRQNCLRRKFDPLTYLTLLYKLWLCGRKMLMPN